ncbi:MAG: hypothetical protein H6P96_1344 [Candidatus Aminicenantes bacterium]|nr:hypothetical protein [Candidatus Aminicenantes bacterium]
MDEVVVGDGPAGLDLEQDRVAVLVGLAGGDELVGLLAVDAEAAALEDGLLVPVEAEPLEIFEDLLEEAGLRALQVRVLDPDEETAARVAGEEPVEDGRPGASDVEEACRRGGEANSNHA